jgi:Transposase DDE domain group 1
VSEGKRHKIGLLRRVAHCFTDYRRPVRIEHPLEEMLAQRIYGLVLGYDDLNDHEQLRQDPLLGVLAGKRASSWVLHGMQRSSCPPSPCAPPSRVVLPILALPWSISV